MVPLQYQEVLLLMIEDIEDSYSFKYAQLCVHSTQDTECQRQMHSKEEWEAIDTQYDFNDEMALVEFLYAQFVVSLRAQWPV